jgi:hypothetical protein
LPQINAGDADQIRVIRVYLRRIFLLPFLLGLLRALITTNRDLFPGHGHLDPAIVDRPITDRTFARVHEFVSLEMN